MFAYGQTYNYGAAIHDPDLLCKIPNSETYVMGHSKQNI